MALQSGLPKDLASSYAALKLPSDVANWEISIYHVSLSASNRIPIFRIASHPYRPNRNKNVSTSLQSPTPFGADL